MNGCEKILRVFAGESLGENAPCAPIIHTGLAPIARVSLGEYFTRPDAMSRVIVEGWRRFAYDGVQLSSGVTAEAEALGARIEQPADGAPLLCQHIVTCADDIDRLRNIDPTTRGRLPMFREAVEMTLAQTAGQACVIATIRGPLLLAAQLMGVETALMTAMTDPELTDAVLDFTTGVAERTGRWLAASGAHAIAIGEATCSPNFIAPEMYRTLVRPRHKRLVAALHEAGWQAAGLHICGNVLAIIDDIVATGVDFFDVDYQTPLAEAIDRVAGRAAMRGNLDPSSELRFASPESVAARVRALRAKAAPARWIVSSGCDIPPGTPAENIEALARTR